MARVFTLLLLLPLVAACPHASPCTADQQERDGACLTPCNNDADCTQHGRCVEGYCGPAQVGVPDGGQASSSGVMPSSSSSHGVSAPGSSSSAGSQGMSLPGSSSLSTPSASSSSTPPVSSSGSGSSSSSATAGSSSSLVASSGTSVPLASSSSALPPLVISNPLPTEFLQYDGPVAFRVTASSSPSGCVLHVGSLDLACPGATTVDVPASALETAGTLDIMMSASDGRTSNTLTLPVRPSGARRAWWIPPVQQGTALLTARLFLFNPHPQAAQVAVKALSALGSWITPEIVAPRSVLVVPLDSLSLPAPTLAVGFELNSNVPITANVVFSRPTKGMDTVEAEPAPLTTWYLAGRYANNTPHVMLLANPGSLSAQASVEEFRGSVPLTPAIAPAQVPPLGAAALALAEPNNSTPVAWTVTLTQPAVITTMWEVTTSTDLNTHGAVGTLLSSGWLLGAKEPDGVVDQVVFFNPGAANAVVTLTISSPGHSGQQVIPVPAGAVTSAPITALVNTGPLHRRLFFASTQPVAANVERVVSTDNCATLPTQPARDHWFPGGTLAAGGTSHLVVHNVGNATADVTVTWMPDVPGAVQVTPYTVAADDTLEIEPGLAQPSLVGMNFGVLVQASVPVLTVMDLMNGSAMACSAPVLPPE